MLFSSEGLKRSKDFGLLQPGYEHPTFRLRDERSNSLRHRRGKPFVISNCAIDSHGLAIRSHGLVIRSLELNNPFSRAETVPSS